MPEYGGLTTVPMSDKVVTIERPEGPVSFSLPKEDFTIDPTALDKDLCALGRVMLDYGEIEAELRLEVDRKDAALERLEADLDTRCRVDLANQAEKVTEKKVEAAINAHPDRLAALDSLAVSRRNWNLMRWAMKALDAKRDCLIAMGYRERQLMKADHY